RSYFPRANTIPRHSRRKNSSVVESGIRTNVTMADRTMEELLQAPSEGYEEAIVIPEILAENFKIKMNLLQLVQANKFHGRENDNPHTHISNFKRMTATLKYRDVLNDAIKLMLFPYSLEDKARIWYEKEPPNSILTWEDLFNKFVNQFFPPSKTTHLKNEISRFTQRFDETFSEAWDRFKELLRACPHHCFSELTQIDTFYNGLTEQDQDSLNAASGGNLLNKMTREALQIIENKSKVHYSRSRSNIARVNTNSRDVVSKINDRIDKLADQISNLVDIINKQVVAPVKVVEKVCVTYGGAHAYYECIATDRIPPSIGYNCGYLLKRRKVLMVPGMPKLYLSQNLGFPQGFWFDHVFGFELDPMLSELYGHLATLLDFQALALGFSSALVVPYVGNKMHKAFLLLGESSQWQYNFPLPVKGVPTARGIEIPLPRVCTAMIKKLPVKENWQLH
nr:reverse transcriptase domain-containing protein [Tanacetum cinerariifolium]